MPWPWCWTLVRSGRVAPVRGVVVGPAGLPPATRGNLDRPSTRPHHGSARRAAPDPTTQRPPLDGPQGCPCGGPELLALQLCGSVHPAPTGAGTGRGRRGSCRVIDPARASTGRGLGSAWCHRPSGASRPTGHGLCAPASGLEARFAQILRELVRAMERQVDLGDDESWVAGGFADRSEAPHRALMEVDSGSSTRPWSTPRPTAAARSASNAPASSSAGSPTSRSFTTLAGARGRG